MLHLSLEKKSKIRIKSSPKYNFFNFASKATSDLLVRENVQNENNLK
jgi:hypothetical protein